ncbi:MAG: RNA polymerase sigma factor SigZ [Verrucomicrobiota bacterium]
MNSERVEQIWQGMAEALRGFIRARVRDPELAEDILQEVFLKIQKNLPGVRASDRLEAWVWRITRNTIADHFRRARPAETLPDKAEVAEAHGPTGDVSAEIPDLGPCVRRFVEQLSPPYREALLQTEWEGLTQKEYAEKFGLTFSGAKTRVQRARRQLKELLLDCCRFELDRRGNVLEMNPRKPPSQRDKSDLERGC